MNICAGCNQPFTPYIRRPDQKYCSERCRHRIAQRRVRAKGRNAMRCKWCKQPIKKPRWIYCSTECSRKWRNNKLRPGAKVEWKHDNYHQAARLRRLPPITMRGTVVDIEHHFALVSATGNVQRVAVKKLRPI